MAVNDEGASGANTTMGSAFGSASARAGAPASAPQAQPRTQGPRVGAFSYSSLGSLALSPMGRSPAAEVLTKLQKALAATYESTNKSFKITLLPIDSNNNRNVILSALVVVVEKNDKPGVLGFHTLILEGSVDAIPPRYEQINGNNVEVLRTAGEAYDAVMIKEVALEVSRQFPNHKLLNAMAEVVPRGLNLEDVDGVVYTLAANAAYAAVNAIEIADPDFIDMNLANASRDDQLVMRPFFQKSSAVAGGRGLAEASVDAVGLPIRSDIVMELSASPVNQQQNQQQGGLDRTTVVGRLAGYLDLIYNPAAPQQGQFAQNQFASQFGQQAPVPTQVYTGRLVLTKMESVQLLTLPAQIFTLIMALGLRENGIWTQALRPSDFASKKFDMHDFGAANIEGNLLRETDKGGLGSPFNLRDASLPPTTFNDMVQALLHPGLVISLDVEECGPTSWINGVFAAAAAGNQKANQEILDATNYLLDGKFAQYFTAGGRVCTDEDNRIHAGYYIDEDGVRQSLDNLDYLAVLNLLGEKDPSRVRAWSDTFVRTDYSLAVRLAERKKIITGLFSSVVFTGFKRRATILPEYLDALAKGAAECGLSVKTLNPYMDQGQSARATGAYVNSMVLGAGASAMFNRGYGAGPAASFAGNTAFPGGRW